VLVCVLWTTVAMPARASPTAERTIQQTNSPPPLKGVLVIPLDLWAMDEKDYYAPVVDQLTEDLYLARQAFLRGDRAEAAQQCRQGAAFLRRYESRAPSEWKPRFARAADDLQTLATRLEAGTIHAMRQMYPAFGVAYYTDADLRWSTADADEWFPLVGKPGKRFQAAHEDFLRRDFKAAATELRKAAAYLRLESSRATDEGKKALQASVRDLEALAREAEQSGITNEMRLKSAFAGAEQALANSHALNAARAWADDSRAKAVQELKAAALDLEESTSWVGQEARKVNTEAVQEARLGWDKLTNETAVAREEFAQTLETLGKRIEELGRQIRPERGSHP